MSAPGEASVAAGNTRAVQDALAAAPTAAAEAEAAAKAERAATASRRRRDLRVAAPLDEKPTTDAADDEAAKARVKASARRAARLAAASTVTAPRPHAQPQVADKPAADKPAAEKPAVEKPAIHVEGTPVTGNATDAATAAERRRAGRRAAEAFSDAIERPAGGRRAVVPVPTTVVPLEPATPQPTAAPAKSAPAADTSVAAQAAPAKAAPAAAVVSKAPASKPLSRRSLRTATPAVPAPEASVEGRKAAGSAVPPTSGAASTAPASGRRGKRAGGVAKGTFSVIAMLFAAGIAVATTMPATAVHSASGASSTVSETVLADVAPLEAQQLTTTAGAASTIARDGYDVSDPRLLQAALRASGIRVADTFTNNPLGSVQWPFPVGVPISSDFGPRESPGGIGSTNHQGVDFTPGEGTVIQSIADGVVSKVVSSDNGGLGVHVIVDHVIDGQAVSSVYGHMLTGSIDVSEGQVIKVAQALGKVGNTGTSTGAHLHLEIRLDGTTAFDPYAWLQANAR
ncbi:peptidoglycan DD-metalloendopeptidase family protein [Herbiconiux liukaitaii]|uniref:peptidoglycan DD-metalloendopeptidase family protein n=1 Tax=Herbiconiux liukaitaii TaxID=3342799 RepID=UPI0035BB087C